MCSHIHTCSDMHTLLTTHIPATSSPPSPQVPLPAPQLQLFPLIVGAKGNGKFCGEGAGSWCLWSRASPGSVPAKATLSQEAGVCGVRGEGYLFNSHGPSPASHCPALSRGRAGRATSGTSSLPGFLGFSWRAAGAGMRDPSWKQMKGGHPGRDPGVPGPAGTWPTAGRAQSGAACPSGDPWSHQLLLSRISHGWESQSCCVQTLADPSLQPEEAAPPRLSFPSAKPFS